MAENPNNLMSLVGYARKPISSSAATLIWGKIKLSPAAARYGG
jgi:hypothetical protein